MIKNFPTFIIVLAFVSIHSLLAQDYQPMREGNISFFSNLQGLRVDSVKQSTDGTEYYFQKTWDYISEQGSYHNTVSPTGPSWLGHKCLVSYDGVHRFIIENKDTCLLKPFSPIGESWKIGEYTDSYNQTFTITGSVLERVEKEFLGLIDSVIVIKLKIFDKNNVELAVPDSSVVELSKNYGYIRIFQFYNFNKYPNEQQIDHTQSFRLIGITNPLSGKIFLTPRQIYNYEIGDEFHNYRESVDFPNNYQWSFATIKKVIDKYVSEDSDTVCYTYNIIRQIKSPVSGETKVDSIYTGIETQKYIFDKKFYLPFEPFFYHNNDTYANYAAASDYFYRAFLSWGERITSSAAENGEVFLPSSDNTWDLQYYHYGGSRNCAEGLGVTYSGYEDMFEWDYEELVYFKKGSEIRGTPLVITSIEDNNSENFGISPNPIKSGESFTIKNLPEGTFAIEIFNALGTQVQYIEDAYGNHNHKLGNLPSGMYFVVVRFGAEKIVGKIVVY